MSKGLRIAVAALSLVAFIGGAITWFIIALDGGDFDAGQAFLGLAYLGAVVVGVLLILFAIQYFDRDRPPRRNANRVSDQTIVVTQLALGTFLIAFGAVLGIVFGVVVEDKVDGVSLAIGTAVIGTGAALLPPGAAAGAGERLTTKLKDKGSGTD